MTVFRNYFAIKEKKVSLNLFGQVNLETYDQQTKEMILI